MFTSFLGVKYMKSNNLIGIFLSGICIIHCLTFPLLTLVLSLDTFASLFYDEKKVHIFLFILVCFWVSRRKTMHNHVEIMAKSHF